MKMFCDRCCKELIFMKPLITCNIVNTENYKWLTYSLCPTCSKKLLEFMDGEAKIKEVGEKD